MDRLATGEKPDPDLVDQLLIQEPGGITFVETPDQGRFQPGSPSDGTFR